MILQTSIKEVSKAIEAYELDCVISFVNDDTKLEDFFPLPVLGHHIFRFADNDIEPQEKHIERLLQLGKAWDIKNDILVHCMSGISRSAAGVYILMCQKFPHQEVQIAETLRQVAPNLWPNERMVEIADDLLGAEGRMIEANQASLLTATCAETTGLNIFPLNGE